MLQIFKEENELIVESLRAQGWAVCPMYFSADLIMGLRADLRAQAKEGNFRAAAIGRGEDKNQKGEVRNDMTLWLDGHNTAQAQFLRVMDDLRVMLNQHLFLGLNDYEAHFAQYAPGGFYKKHRDAFTGQKNRMVSTVTYLTPHWQEEEEGHLVLYDGKDEEQELTRILPRAGTLAVFLSEDIPHEVLPPTRTRESIAGWFRCDKKVV